jgi:N-glycosylase/DNA lyase
MTSTPTQPSNQPGFPSLITPSPPLPSHITWPVRAYDLDATLSSGQVFNWHQHGSTWQGVVAGRWVELQQPPTGIQARCTLPQTSWNWLADYLQIHLDLDPVLPTFPSEPPLQSAVRQCYGLRLLRQDPWECLANFLLSATKQITQIRRISLELARLFGCPVPVPAGHPQAFAFPTATQIANTTEADLRQCAMGFRAPHLKYAARLVANGDLDLHSLRHLPLNAARAMLIKLPGVGPKIADCVLLFSCDQPQAFPVDTWIARTLRQLYFDNQPIPLPQLRQFTQDHFGPYAGYAQQYLFHYARTHLQPHHP